MKNIDNKTNKAIFACLIGNCIWGLGNTWLKLAMNYAVPSVMLAYRFTLAFIILNIWWLFGKKKISLKGKNIKPFLIFIAIEPICFFLESYSVYITNATITGMVMAATPLVAMLFAIVFLKEYPTKLQIIFMLLPIAGVIMITVAGKSIGVISSLGLMILILFMFASATYKTANRGAAKDFTPFERTYFLIGGCMITYVIFALIQTKCSYDMLIEPATHFGFAIPIVIMAIFNSVLANALVNYSAGIISVTKLSTIGAVSTITSTIAGIIFLKEPWTYSMIIGTIMIIIGVYIVSKKGQ